MKHRKPKAYPIWSGDFVPRSIHAVNDALPDVVQEILDLIDTGDPAWPSIAAVLREFLAAGIEITQDSAAMAVKLGKGRWEEVRFPAASGCAIPGTLAVGAASIVYYVRRGPLIKIGTTVDPAARFRDLMPDEIFAIEPGGHAEEALRHRQFWHLRASGEYFRDAQELRDHMAVMRAMHGEPDPSWPTSTAINHPGSDREWRLPPPTSMETMTAKQAEAELGIKQHLIRVWVHRGRIEVVGHGWHGSYLYYREHLIALRDSARRRMVTST